MTITTSAVLIPFTSGLSNRPAMISERARGVVS